ncbi:MAG: hypothetical protein FJZ94_03790 [Chloroflexi bacterium]|nr:hypothetical protein [Chloroflexota bacterium]MBM3166553.1 hypothetical protein [Chloroflexota bacterium]
MPDPKTAFTVFMIVAGAGVAMILGDYLGGRIGRAKLALAVGILILVAMVAFVVFYGISTFS